MKEHVRGWGAGMDVDASPAVAEGLVSTEEQMVLLEDMHCFVCGQPVEGDMVLIVNAEQDDMVCVCQSHITSDTKAKYQPVIN